MKEPQVFFNWVTDLIIDALTTEILKNVAIVTASVFKNVVSTDDKITCQEFWCICVSSLKLSARDLTKITEYVKPHSHKWKEIGQGLGFTADELSNIEARLTLLFGAPYSYLSAMLSNWLLGMSEGVQL